MLSDIAPVGYFYDGADPQPQPCPIGFYQDQPGQLQCIGCNPGETTLQIASNSSADCQSELQLLVEYPSSVPVCGAFSLVRVMVVLQIHALTARSW